MVKYFSERVKEKSEVIPNFPGVPFRSLSEEDAQVLTAHFLIEELQILVNKCSNQEIKIERGLKYGDPLAHFLFLLVVDGLSGFIKRDYDLFLLFGFNVGVL